MITDVIIFVFGLVFGSFLNVCIYRFPREESIVSPGSHCPYCNAPIAWYHNIPVISYVMLLGKCAKCKGRISPRYVFVELLTGALWVFLYRYYGLTGHFWAGIVLLTILLGVSITDIETGYIPDNFTLPGAAAGIALSTLYPELHGRMNWYDGLFESCLGILLGGGFLLAIGMIGNWIFKKDSMGGGDIKMLGMLGAFMGWKFAWLVFLFAPILSLPIALYVKFRSKGDTIRFGPYLAIVAAAFFLYGKEIVEFIFPSVDYLLK